MAAELGFEPRQTESESVVLPLHNSAPHGYYIIKIKSCQVFFGGLIINFKINEKISLWEHIAGIGSAKHIVLYGMGNGADKIFDICEAKNIKISGVFASDGFVRGHFFRGYKVKKFSEIIDEYKDICILTAFAARESEVIGRIYKLDADYELYAPNFPVFGEGYPDYKFFKDNIGEVKKAYSLLSDDFSRVIFENAVNFMISGKLKYLKNTETPKSGAFDTLGFGGDLIYADAGAYDGDTILELKNYLDKKNLKIKKITAFEPDKKNFIKLEKNMAENGLLDICELHNAGVWNKKTTLLFDFKSGRNSSVCKKGQHKQTKISAEKIDSVSKNPPDLIKYDVEGSEYEAIEGSKEIIKKYSPRLIVSLYHRREDIFRLPLLIREINPGYKFYIRKHRYIPCWDLNLYAVPEN